MTKKGEALAELADLANAVSGDFHMLHLNFRGAEFDTMHKKVLKTYYEQAADDYDALAEWASCFLDERGVANPNESAVRIDYKSFDYIGYTTKKLSVDRINVVLETLCSNYLQVFRAFEKENCPVCIGVANWLQGRLEYWGKEMAYFNARRQDEHI